MGFDNAKLSEDLRRANELARDVAEKCDDNGSCNLDAVFLQIPRVRETSVLEAIKNAGLYCRAKTTWGWMGSGYMLRPTVKGQANRRAKAVEAMANSLTEDGWDATVYYQMD